MNMLWQYQARAEPVFVPPAPPHEFVPSVMRPTNTPIFVQEVGIAIVVMATVGTLLDPNGFETSVSSWWRQPSEPVFTRPVLVQEGSFTWSILPPVQDVPDSATWFRPASEPLFTTPDLVQTGVFVTEVQIPTPPSMNSWYVAASEPLVLPLQLISEGEFSWNTLEIAPAVPDLATWFQLISRPLFSKPEIVQEGEFSWDMAQIATPAMDSWFRPASEPVFVTAPLVQTGHFSIDANALTVVVTGGQIYQLWVRPVLPAITLVLVLIP